MFKKGDLVRYLGKTGDYCANLTHGCKYQVKQSNVNGSSSYVGIPDGPASGHAWFIPNKELRLIESIRTENVEGERPTKLCTSLPVDSKDRKEFPLYSGPLKYFPKAIVSVAQICKIGNDKHNPGEPLHHARGKSNDHEDCIMRHLIDMGEDFGHGVGKDEQGVPQVAYIAWRALALAQEWYEKNDGAPLAPGAKQ